MIELCLHKLVLAFRVLPDILKMIQENILFVFFSIINYGDHVLHLIEEKFPVEQEFILNYQLQVLSLLMLISLLLNFGERLRHYSNKHI